MRSPAERLEHALSPWTAYLILPVFAAAHAGIAVSAGDVWPPSRVSLGILCALFLGKPAGVLLAVWLTERAGLGARPAGATWTHLLGAGCLCGVGFTMSIFVAGEAFPDPARLAEAKLAVMAASLLSALAGWAVLRFLADPAHE